MTAHYDNRDDERDWPGDDAAHQSGNSTPDSSVQPEREDDAGHLPVRHTRRPLPRKRASYRPPSELDSD